MNTPTQIVENVRRALEARDYRAYADCFAENGVYERPYALPGTPDKYQGAAKIYEYIAAGMAAANKLFDIISVEAQVHLCAEDGLVFAEFFLSGKPLSGDDEFRIASSAALIYCKDGKITTYRDFPNSAGIAKSAGTIELYAASLTK